jgi:hypothetical protein
VTVGVGAQVLAGSVQTDGSDQTGTAGSVQTGAAGSDHWRACTSGQAVASCRGVSVDVMNEVTITVTLVGSEVERIIGAAEAVEVSRSAKAKMRNNIFEKSVEKLSEAEANSFAVA